MIQFYSLDLQVRITSGFGARRKKIEDHCAQRAQAPKPEYRMEALITSHGLDAAEFRKRLAAAGGIVAGSAALAEFFRANNQDPGFEPGDMDIWLYTHNSTYTMNKMRAQAETTPSIMEKIATEVDSRISQNIHRMNELSEQLSNYLSQQNISYITRCSLGITNLCVETMDLKKRNTNCKNYRNIYNMICEKHCQTNYNNVVSLIEANSVLCKDMGMEVSEDRREAYAYMDQARIYSVKEYRTATDKKIQVITVEDSFNVPLTSYMKKAFDLSCCMAYWDPVEDRVSHLFPEFTLKRRMMLMDCELNAQRERRIAKYVSRGFELRKSMLEPPTFAADSQWHTQTCTEVVTFDEPSVAVYLAEPEDHVVLKSGEQYYGFSRQLLIKYLQQHSFTLADGTITYTTPLRHKLRVSELDKLKNNYNYIFSVGAESQQLSTLTVMPLE